MVNDKPIIFCDMDGCIASQGKIWQNIASSVHSELKVEKTISDHDSWAIDHFKKYAHIIIISGDERINRAWAERRGIPFIYTCAAGFHQDKWKHLEKYWKENFAKKHPIVKSWSSHISLSKTDPAGKLIDSPVGKYYYLGDAIPDYKCMVNAKRAFLPDDASAFIVNKVGDDNFTWLNTNSGQGCFDSMAWLLVQEGVLPDVI